LPLGTTYTNPITRGPSIDAFPRRKRLSLKYGDAATITTTGNQWEYGTAVTVLLNSLFAPTSGGVSAHQPYGFDQWAAIYSRYRVDAVDMTMQIMYNGGVQNSVVSGVVLPPGTSATIAASTYSIVNEKPLTFNVPIVGGTNAGTVFVKQRFDIAQLAGLTQMEHAANIEDYSAAVTASPSKVVSFEFATCGVSTTTATSSKVLLTFEFHCEFWEPKILTQS
jgi:hypothetical protein